MIPTTSSSLTTAWLDPAAPAARADGTVADHSRHVTGELPVIRPDANRDDLDLMGHRVTELTTDRAAA